MGGHLLYVPCQLLVALGRGHLVAEALVLGFVVKELMVAEGDYLGDGEHQFLLFGAEHAAVEFSAGDAFFYEDLAVFGECFLDGGQ